MDDDFIVTAYVVIAETPRALEHRDHPLAGVSDAEVLTVAVVATRHFRNHHAQALATFQRQGYLFGGAERLALQPTAARAGRPSPCPPNCWRRETAS